MDTNAILTADLLDVIFDNRNKEYGAYELRRSYSTRIITSLLFTSVLIGTTFSILAFTSKAKSIPAEIKKDSVVVIELPIDLPPKEVEAQPSAPPPAAATQTQAFTTNLQMVDNQTHIEAPPEQTDLTFANVGSTTSDGVPAGENVIVETAGTGNNNENTTQQPQTPEVIEESVDIPASFDGNWTKFLLRNLDGNTPVENNAPAGVYKVMIQFVVDLDGAISDIRPLTNHGFGLEEEAIRVIKKSKNWEPGVKKGVKVKSYRRQPITFEVTEE